MEEVVEEVQLVAVAVERGWVGDRQEKLGKEKRRGSTGALV